MLVAGKNPNEGVSAKPAFKVKYDVLQISVEANIYLACERRRVTQARAEDGVTLAVCVGSRGSNCGTLRAQTNGHGTNKPVDRGC